MTPNQAIHRMTAPRRQLRIRTALEGAVIGDLGRTAFPLCSRSLWVIHHFPLQSERRCQAVAPLDRSAANDYHT
jgi:hypothetical protein